VVGVVWEEAPESTTHLVGEGRDGKGTRCVERTRGGALTWPLGGEGDNGGSIAKEAITARRKTVGPST
jgi:GTPase involved in cell partitioning and DNA repair